MVVNHLRAFSQQLFVNGIYDPFTSERNGTVEKSITSEAKLMNAYKLRFLPTPLRGNTSCSHNFIMTLTIFSASLRVSAAGIMPESLSINFKRKVFHSSAS